MRRSLLAFLVVLVAVPVACQTATVLPNGQVLLVMGDVARIFDPAAGTLTPTGAPTAPRVAHTATLLPDGRVLFAGGGADSGSLASAELYDPGSGTFAATGALGAARAMHAAVLLRDGRVLVAGGGEISSGEDESPPPLVSAELYDPASGTFSPTGSMGTGRVMHTATLLPDGRVLFLGGSSADVPIASAELYDPASGAFSPTGSLGAPRALHTATPLADGRVLVVGGLQSSLDTSSGDSTALLASAELYDPAAGTFTPTGTLAAARAGHTATLLPDGRVLIAGGLDANSEYLASAELYDPASGTFTATGSLSRARGMHTASPLADGRVLLVGGDTDPASSEMTDPFTSAEVYDPATGTFTALDIPQPSPAP